MILSLIWAQAHGGVIGDRNRLPWRLPVDMRWFRRHTLGKPVIMGRRTFESFGGRPLPERRNIVLSRDPAWSAEGVERAGSLEEALGLVAGEPEVMVIGGAGIYRQAMPLADRLYVTFVDLEVEGDTRFPPLDWSRWRERERHHHAADEANPHPCDFVIFERA